MSAERGRILVTGGVAETLVGVDDLFGEARYWERFGFSVTARGRLDAASADALYGVRSALESLLLGHTTSDHGLIRLMRFDEPTGPGLGTRPLSAWGSRWTTQLADLGAASVHAELAEAAGEPFRWIPPVTHQIYPAGTPARPFVDPWPCVREMAVLRPCSRQVLFERYAYELPDYGQRDPTSLFRGSQITHVGVTIIGSPDDLVLYPALGMAEANRPVYEASFEEAGARALFELQPGQRYWSVDFDDPRSTPSRPRSGRLKVIVFPPGTDLEDARPLARVGNLGPTASVLRVSDLRQALERFSDLGGQACSEPCTDELGRPALRASAPEGTEWLLVEAT
jgi:hypothetical protein